MDVDTPTYRVVGWMLTLGPILLAFLLSGSLPAWAHRSRP